MPGLFCAASAAHSTIESSGRSEFHPPVISQPRSISSPMTSAHPPSNRRNQPVKRTHQASTAEAPIAEASFRQWSRVARLSASVLLVGYLALVILGPLSNPIASPHLTAKAALIAAPLQRATFLGHGYRFFAPDPGASHRVLFRVYDETNGANADAHVEATTIHDGHFPDRNQTWPRLLYHRWFMLSETLYNEFSLLPSEADFKLRDAEYEVAIADLQRAGKLDLQRAMGRERELEQAIYDDLQARCNLLTSALAGHLLTRHGGNRIEIWLQERGLPFPEQVLNGSKLDDAEFLSTPVKIAEYRREVDRKLTSVPRSEWDVAATSDTSDLEVALPIDLAPPEDDRATPRESLPAALPLGGGQ